MSMALPSSRHKATSTGQPSARQAPNPFGDPPSPHRTTRAHTTHAPTTRSVPHSPRTHTVPQPSATRPTARQPHKPRDHMDNVVVKNGIPIDAHRTKPNRSMTSAPAPPAPPAPTRSLSTDQFADKARKPSPRPPAKKSSHVDVIDKLDYSGIGAATFHHDGPFDACAPSRNKNKTKAPMYAFDDVPLQQAEGVSNKHLSPLAQATILAMKQSPGSSPYAVAVNTNTSSYGQPPSPTYASPKKKPPKKSALAEAWGIAEPEPFEEFSAGRQSGYERDSPMNGSLTSINNPSARTGMTTRAEPFPDYADGSRPQPTRRPSRALPPPQPIQLYPEFPGGEDPTPMTTAPSAYGARPGAPKRSKSLMQRFRKMRDSPNAPPQYEEEPPQAPPASDIRLVTQGAPPVPERGPKDTFVMVGNPRDKNLPAPPPVVNAEHFETQDSPVSPGAHGGVNRKGSLMRKVKGVMSR